MGYCRTCPDCGSNLDPNEKCDCQNKNEKEAKGYVDTERDLQAEKNLPNEEKAS